MSGLVTDQQSYSASLPAAPVGVKGQNPTRRVIKAPITFRRCFTARHEDCLGAYEYKGNESILFLCACEFCKTHNKKIATDSK